MNWNGYKSKYSINPTSIHGKIRCDSQHSPCKQQRTQLTMFCSKVSERKTPANVSHVLYSTKGFFQRATHTTAALRCRIYSCGDDNQNYFIHSTVFGRNPDTYSSSAIEIYLTDITLLTAVYGHIRPFMHRTVERYPFTSVAGSWADLSAEFAQVWV